MTFKSKFGRLIEKIVKEEVKRTLGLPLEEAPGDPPSTPPQTPPAAPSEAAPTANAATVATPPLDAAGGALDPAAILPPGEIGADPTATDPNADPSMGGAPDTGSGGASFGGFGGGGLGGGGSGGGDDPTVPPSNTDEKGEQPQTADEVDTSDPIQSMLTGSQQLLTQTQDPNLILKDLKGKIQAVFKDPSHALGMVKALYDTNDTVLQSVAQRLYMFIKTSMQEPKNDLEKPSPELSADEEQ